MTPTQRSLAHFRKLGHVAELVGRWNPHSKTRRDLWNIVDLLVLDEQNASILGVQVTSGSNVAARVKKIAESEHLAAIRKCGVRIIVHGWRKAANGRWTLREVDCS